MTTVNIDIFSKDAKRYLKTTENGFNPLKITNSEGKNLIVLQEEQLSGMSETLYLESIPGMVESILAASNEDRSEWIEYRGHLE